MGPLLQLRKVAEDPVDRPDIRIVRITHLASLDTQKQVIQNGELRENTPILRNIPNARLSRLEGRKPRNLFSLKDYRSGLRFNQTHDGLQGRALPHPVPAQKGNQLPVGNVQGNPLQYMARSIKCIQFMNFQQHFYHLIFNQ